MVAIITGAGSGIGRAIAIALANRGAELWLLGRRVDALEQTKELAGCGTVYPMDIGNEGDCGKFVEQLEVRPDWLVHSAGLMPIGDFGDAHEEAIRTNFLGPLALTFTLLERVPGCRPVFLLSDTVFGPLAGATVYSATKTALHAFVRQQRSWDPVEVFPPVTRTAMTDVANESCTWIRNFLACPLEVGERTVREMLAGRRMIYLSFASRNGLSRAIYRKLVRYGRLK